MTEARASLEESLRCLLERIGEVDSSEALEQARIAALGRRGFLSTSLKQLGTLPATERREQGERLNRAKEQVSAAVAARAGELEAANLATKLEAERLDVSLPIETGGGGRIHPVNRITDEMITLFAALGFRVADGPDIEDSFHSFEALNIPAWHPARQEMDTFYLQAQGGETERPVLRPHTSPVQIRTMLAEGPPLRIVAPGRTFRSDSDATHVPMFHQLEALVIEKGIHMGHLRGTIETFLRAFFDRDDLKVRFRPSYFPFTEPSAEVDIGCKRTAASIDIGGEGDWLEILGCGMVHPKVLENCNIDPQEWQGFAWGIGIERMAALKYGAPDLRSFTEGDLDWLERYGFHAHARASTTWGE